MDDFLFVNTEDVKKQELSQHPKYGFSRQVLAPREAERTALAIYEIPPGKSNFPYHYHMMAEESFLILSGEGVVKTPKGEIPCKKGDFFFFPAGEKGAHKFTNTSASEPLVYIDFDAKAELDSVVYPDSGKIAIYGKGLRNLYRINDMPDYYEGE